MSPGLVSRCQVETPPEYYYVLSLLDKRLHIVAIPSLQPTEFAAGQARQAASQASRESRVGRIHRSWPSPRLLRLGDLCNLLVILDTARYDLVRLKVEVVFATAHLSNCPPAFIRVHASTQSLMDPSSRDDDDSDGNGESDGEDPNLDLDLDPPSRGGALRGRA